MKLLIEVELDKKDSDEYFAVELHAWNAGSLLQDIYQGEVDGSFTATLTDEHGEILRETK